MIKKFNIPALSMRAAMQPATLNAERRTVDLVWSKGAPVLRSSWSDGPYFEELSLDPKHVRMGRLTSGSAPLLDSHSAYGVGSVLGVIESARLEAAQGVATVRFPAEGISAEADKVFRLVKDGILQNVSVGYRTHKFEKVEGGDASTPTYRAIDWEPYEISICPMGADAGATVRAEKTETNECEFVNSGATRQTGEKQVTEEEKRAAALKVAEEVEKRQVELKNAQEAAARSERERASGIRSAVRAAKLEDSIADKLVADGSSLDQAREFVLTELAERNAALPPSETAQVSVRVVEDGFDKMKRGVTAWFLSRSGLTGLVKQASESKVYEVRNALANIDTDPAEFRGLSMLDIARMSLEKRGVNTRGMDKMKIVGLALTHRAGGYATTSDFAVLFENVMYKTLLASYAVTEDTWSKFCGVDQVSDFKASNRFRTGSFDSLEDLDEHGEFKRKSIPDGEKTSISVATQGYIMALSRQAIINDDMGALSDMTVKMGRAARLSIEKAVYALLAAGGGLGAAFKGGAAFFDASRGNVGTGAALAVASLDADRLLMRSQMDMNSNEYLDLRPSVLLVPVGLETSAKIINTAAWDPDTSNKLQKPNAAQGIFTEIVATPRLSGTRRYMFANPAKDPAIKVVFLEGQGQAPVLESEEGFSVDGTSWKVRLDYAVCAFDPKCAVTNAGTP